MDKGYLETLFTINGKTAVVTGGGGILCSSLSNVLARLGVRVAVLDILEEAAQKVVDGIQAGGHEALAVRCDVLERASIEAAAEKVVQVYGPVDFLINGAGGNKKQATTSLNLSFFDLPQEAIQ
ncbi:MAG: SDR family NAD(P)-dependent oxidoreductase [Candidatus Atribacteria bacterium]|nr:SDR family NAD(P)-dependent oxidoreductase [Candidatus Atribacteria bacterium]